MSEEGKNAILTVKDYGSYRVRVETLAYDLKILSSESEGRNTRAFYPQSSGEEGFFLMLLFLSTYERDQFNNWLFTYMTKISANENIGGVVTVEVPSRNYVRQGIPTGVLNHGASWNEVTIREKLEFSGTLNPIDAVGVGGGIRDIGGPQKNVPGTSHFEDPNTDLVHGLFYYPASIQSGLGAAEGTLYNGIGKPSDNRLISGNSLIPTTADSAQIINPGSSTPYYTPPPRSAANIADHPEGTATGSTK